MKAPSLIKKGSETSSPTEKDVPKGRLKLI